MADPSAPSAFASALPVVIGGLLAIGGGAAAQLITYVLAEKREYRNLRRERMEAFVKALFADRQWICDRLDTMVFRNEDHNLPSPLSEAQMLQRLHFPELAHDLKSIGEKQVALIAYIGEQRVIRMQKSVRDWAQIYKAQTFREVFEPYSDAIYAATAKCGDLLDSR